MAVMTREETIKVLAILKAAYPNAYKGMTREEAQGTVSVWAMQFASNEVFGSKGVSNWCQVKMGRIGEMKGGAE